MKKWQLSGVIIGLLVLLYGMNYISQMQQEKAKALAKAAEQAKQAAELKATAGAEPPSAKHAGKGAAVFQLPQPSGPPTAPIKVEIFVDSSNSCHETSLQLKDIARVYGSKVRVEYYTISDPKVSERCDKMALGCDAGIAFNGKIELMVRTAVGKKLVSFRGPVGEKFRPDDVYAAINTLLGSLGKPVPAAAVKLAKSSGLGGVQAH